MYDYAIELRRVDSNPASMVATKYVGTAVRRSRFLTPKEIHEYLHIIYKSNTHRQFPTAHWKHQPLFLIEG